MPLDLPLKRLRPTVENLRALMREDAEKPERAAATKTILGTFGRQRIPEKIDLPRGKPEIESGTIMDFSKLGEYPHAYLERARLPMHARGVPESFEPALAPGMLRKQIDYAREGSKRGGWSWYDMAPLHDFVDRYIDPSEHHLAQRFMNISHPMSMRTSVPNEIQNTSAIHRLMEERQDFPTVDEFRQRRLGASSGDVQRLQLAHDSLGGVGDLFGPTFIDRAPKVIPYGLSKSGNLYVPAIDRHSLAAMDLPESAKAETKGGASLILQELAARSGMMPSQLQASQWTGRLAESGRGGSSPAPWPLLLDRMVRHDAELKSKNPTQHMIDVMTGRDDLSNVPKFAGGGEVMQGLKKYYLSRIPKKLGVKDIESLYDDHTVGDEYGGSSRHLWRALGPDKPLLLKTAKRPRGLYETSLEGEPRVARYLPKVEWRDPDNSMALVEEMKLHPAESNKLMDPMKRHFEDLYGEEARRFGFPGNVPPYRVHRDDPWMGKSMSELGLDPFKQFDIHGPDFFMAPERHWTVRGMDRSMPPHTRGLTLLDPGALDYRVTRGEFEKQFAPSFRDVLSDRIENITGTSFSPEELIGESMQRGSLIPLSERFDLGRGTEDFMGPMARFRLQSGEHGVDPEEVRRIRARMPNPYPTQPPKLVTGNARGGLVGDPRELLRSARARLAGGGPPRNWYRGFKGSDLDKALAALRERALPEHLREFNEAAARLNGMDERGVQTTKRGKAIDDWVNRNFTNYVTRDFATPNDPLKDFEWSGHRINAKNVLTDFGAADIPTRVIGERVGDGGPRGRNRGNWRELEQAEWDKKRDALVAEMPGWLRKHYDQDLIRAQREQSKQSFTKYKPDNPFVDISSGLWDTHIAPEMHGVLDYLNHAMTPQEGRGALLQPDRLSRMSVPDAVRQSRAWHEELARKAEEAKNAPIDFSKTPWFKTHKEYPTGFRWVKYDPDSVPSYTTIQDVRGKTTAQPEYDAFRGALAAEGESMGHCVGSYCDQVIGGDTQIYSLRDKRGQPHVTVEVKPQRPVTKDPLTTDFTANVIRNQHPGLMEEYEDSFFKSGERTMRYASDFWPWVKKSHPEIHAKYSEPGLDIAQIKGKANRKPNDEYLPYVQDFVRSGKWGEVGDLNNTGLVKIDPRTSSLSNATDGRQHMYATEEELAPFRRYMWGGEWLTEDEMVEQVRAHGNSSGMLGASSGIKPEAVPDYVRRLGTSSHGRSWRYDIPPDWKPGEPQFAKGGQVERDPGFPQESANEQLERAMHALAILRNEQAQNPGDPALEREIARVEALIEKLSKQEGATLATSEDHEQHLESLPMPQRRQLNDDAMDLIHGIINADPEHGDLLDQLMGQMSQR